MLDICQADIMRLDLDLLRVFDALLETGSVTRAGERLGLSQPATSAALARLRATFGDPLFVRQSRGLRPTPRAEALAGPVRRLLEDARALLRPTAFDPKVAQGVLRIAATDYAQVTLVLPFITCLRTEAPGLTVSVQPVEPETLVQRLESGQLDIALVTAEMASGTLKSRRLFDENYVCILRVRHPSADTLDIDRFCELDHAILSHGGLQSRGVTDAALQTHGRSRRVVAVLPSFLAVIDLVRRSELVAVIPARLAACAEGIISRPPPVPINGFTKIAVWHERSHHDPCHAWARDRLAALSTGA